MAASPTLICGAYRLRYRDPFRHWDAVLRNGVTAQGANYLVGVGFKAAPKLTGWRLGLIDSIGYVQVLPGDTHDTHPGWREFGAVFNATRPAWSPADPTGGAMDSAAATAIQITAAGNVRGVFLASVATVGSLVTTAVLYSTAVSATDLPVSAGGILAVTYKIQALPTG